MKKSTVLTLAFLTSSIAIAAEDEHREHGAHEHGHATLNVIVEKNDLLVILESPAMNVFGFEHKPENHEQTTIAELAVKDLENFSSLVTLDENAKCSINKATINQPFKLGHDDHEHGNTAEHKDDEHHDDHKDEHKHDEHKDEHKHAEHKDDEHHDDHKGEHKDHDEDHKESTHSDVDIEISYSCKYASKLTKMDLTPLFKRFPLFVELDAQGIINGQQSASELSKKQAIFSLKK